MKIIITGATGFLGRNLAERFHEDGFQVRATGRNETQGEALQKQGIEWKSSDILDADRLINAFSPADCVIHCAAKAGPWGRYRVFYDANVIGTRNVIATCRYHDIKKIIFVSTPSIYFNGEDRYDITEAEPLPKRLASNYAKTKRINEKELLALQDEGFKTIIFRPRALFGPHDNAFVPRILRMAEKKQMPMINDGQALVDITYVDDFVNIVKIGLSAPDHAWNQVYNVSNGDPITIKAWLSQILEVFGKPFKPKNIPEPMAKCVAGCMEFISYLPFIDKEPPMTRFSVGYMAKSMTLNIDKAKEMLGYTPGLTNQEGFKRYAQWARSTNRLK